MGGGQGGNFNGYQGGMAGGRQQDNYDQSVRNIEDKISNYLNGEEIKNILTPGEYCEWILDLKAGQVVIAEARSEAFDPAIEIVDGKLNILGTNDDRYPGDQRPLLLWRCAQDGKYNLHVRCFRNKSGGQFFLRYRVYDTVDLESEKPVEKKFDTQDRILVRVPMKQGQIKRLVFESSRDGKIMPPRLLVAISPVGLPDINLADQYDQVLTNSIIAPVDGDYYYLADFVWGTRNVRGHTEEIVPSQIDRTGSEGKGTAKTNAVSVWKIKVKAGEILEFSTSDLILGSRLAISSEPSFSEYNLKDPEKNPFYPKVKSNKVQETEPFTMLPSRARDSRTHVCAVNKDLTLWVASDGAGLKDQTNNLVVSNALRGFDAGKQLTHRLRIGNTDYWSFDAKMGDVMAFKVAAKDFATNIIVRRPDLGQISVVEAQPDQESVAWNTIISQPGRYLIAVSAFGDGGGGEYTLSRTVYPAKQFSKGSPAKGVISKDEVHVWSFAATPDEPFLVHYKNKAGLVGMTLQDSSGHPVGFAFTPLSVTDHYAIFRVTTKTSFLLVLTGYGSKDEYLIEFLDIPGYKKGDK
jgi:hypothetical protein